MYCNNFLRSQAMRAKLLEKGKYKVREKNNRNDIIVFLCSFFSFLFQEWIEKQNERVGDDLDSLLIRPIQRQSRFFLPSSFLFCYSSLNSLSLSPVVMFFC